MEPAMSYGKKPQSFYFLGEGKSNESVEIVSKAIVFFILVVGLFLSLSAKAGSQHYDPGVSASFTVPAGVTAITISAVMGGGGGGGSCGGIGGYPGTAGSQTNTYTVTPGEVLQIQTQVGGPGGCGGGGGGAGGSVWVSGPGVDFFARGGDGGEGSGGGCIGGCGGNGGDSTVDISWP